MVNDPATGALCPFDFEQIAKAVPEIREFGFSINSYTLPEIIDSSDLKPALWADLCQIILDKYDQYSGFVILHGTDTMAYSAAALSFMLNNLTKPVVFTGSQLPIGTIRTDGRENLIAALEIAVISRHSSGINRCRYSNSRSKRTDFGDLWFGECSDRPLFFRKN